MSVQRMVSRRRGGEAAIVVVFAVLLLLPAAAVAQEREGELDRDPEALREVLAGLEHGMAALERLGRPDAHEMLDRIADEVRRAIEERDRPRARERERGPDRERQIVRERIETMHLALPALHEGQHHDMADRLEHAIGAGEVALEGRRDREAREIREGAPGPEEILELLGHAEAAYREMDMAEEAEAVRRGAELWRGRERGEPRRERAERDRPERDRARHVLEIMRSALPALLEEGRRDTAEILEREIRAREVALEGRRDPEAREIRGHAPEPGQVVEILHFAARLWREFEAPERAEPLEALADELWSTRERRSRERPAARGERRPSEGEERHVAALERLEHIQARLMELQHQMHAITEELEALRREHDR